MKSPEIQHYWCTEIEDLDHWQPADPEYVDLWFSVAIGIEGESENGADNFLVHLVTQKQLSQIEEKEYLLVIPFYISWSEVMDALKTSIAECKDINWRGMSLQLEKLYHWEYHNFRR